MAKNNVEDLNRCDETNKYCKLNMALPIAPSVNHMYIHTRKGGKTLSKNAEKYIRETRALINLYVEKQKWKKAEKGVWCYVDVIVFMPDKRIRDSHNMIKLLMDVMQGIVFENDYYALPRIQGVEYDKEDPRIEVSITHQTKVQRNKILKTANIM